MHQVVLKRAAEKKADLISPAAEYPKIVQMAGLYILELGFSPEEETRSLPVRLQLDLSGFGEVLAIAWPEVDRTLSSAALGLLEKVLRQATPPMGSNYESSDKTLTIHFLQDTPKRQRTVGGIAILNPRDELVSLVISLH